MVIGRHAGVPIKRCKEHRQSILIQAQRKSSGRTPGRLVRKRLHLD